MDHLRPSNRGSFGFSDNSTTENPYVLRGWKVLERYLQIVQGQRQKNGKIMKLALSELNCHGQWSSLVKFSEPLRGDFCSQTGNLSSSSHTKIFVSLFAMGLPVHGGIR